MLLVACTSYCRRFTKEYFAEPRRGYGANVPVVFGALRKSDFEQPFLPAREQFNGTGSFGNGGGSRTDVPMRGEGLADATFSLP